MNKHSIIACWEEQTWRKDDGRRARELSLAVWEYTFATKPVALYFMVRKVFRDTVKSAKHPWIVWHQLNWSFFEKCFPVHVWQTRGVFQYPCVNDFICGEYFSLLFKVVPEILQSNLYMGFLGEKWVCFRMNLHLGFGHSDIFSAVIHLPAIHCVLYLLSMMLCCSPLLVLLFWRLGNRVVGFRDLYPSRVMALII